GGYAIFLVVTNNPDPNVAAKSGIVRTVCEFAAGCLLYRIYTADTMKVNAGAVVASTALIVVGLLVPALAIVTVFGFPVMILLAARPYNPLAAMLSSQVMVFLGEISYSIYLLHRILIQASNRLQETFHIHGAVALLWFFCFLALVIVLSTVNLSL